jgi:predicted glycosyltransferase
MPLAKRRALRRAAQGKPVTLLEFTPDLLSYLAAADIVVSMAGYNTVCEILTLQKRAVLIPRVHVREEQTLRADRLAARGLVDLLHPRDLTPRRLAHAIQDALAAAPPAVDLNLNGLARASQAISSFLDNPTPRPLTPTRIPKESFA